MVGLERFEIELGYVFGNEHRAFEPSLPPVYRWARLDHPDFRPTVSLATLSTRPPSAKRLVFSGHAGTGKTTLAVALLRVLLESKIASHPFVSDDDVAAVARQCRFAPGFFFLPCTLLVR